MGAAGQEVGPSGQLGVECSGERGGGRRWPVTLTGGFQRSV
jgi:hypothetical protein